MNDLISKTALLEFAHNHIGGMIDCNDIARFPTIDAVQVVRCNDCELHGHCTFEDTFRIVRLQDGYCRVGKRRKTE